MKEFWSYKSLQKVPENFRLSMGEGKTPIRSAKIEDLTICIKDENSNPNGSFKDRSLAYQVSYHVSKGINKFVISSSGNAAVSAAAYCGLAGVELDIFVADTVNEKKLAKIKNLLNGNIRLHQSSTPRSDAIKFAHENVAFDLRGSKDDKAIEGYKTIAYELVEEYPQIDSIFIPCSSGTSTLGIYKAFKELKKKVRIFPCQTSKIHAIASRFDKDFVKSNKSFADAITDRVAARKKEVINAVKESGGTALVINDALLYQAKEILEAQGLYYSYNSLLSVAGFLKSVNKGIKLNNPVVLASGL